MVDSETRMDHMKRVIDTDALTKLIQEQAKGTEKSQESKKLWTQYRDDYDSLRKQLETISDKVSHKVMVPFGRFAFMPGTLKHTNEVTVLLGDNWFAERSAKQAAGIVDRRLKQCTEMLEKLEKEEQLYESWRKQTEAVQSELDTNKGMEIVEDFDEVQEKLWRAQHKESVREHHQKLAEERKNRDCTSTKTVEEDLWRRLDELELQEELEHEADLQDEKEDDSESSVIHEECEENQENGEEAKELERKRVTWSEADSIRHFRRDEVIDSKEDSTIGTNRIAFRHTKTSMRPSNDVTNEYHIRSPSDIYNAFNINADETPEPKSILRVKKSTTPIHESPPEPQKIADKPVSFVSTTCPISDEIKEREPLNSAAPSEEPVQPIHRPVSRFKAARQASRSFVP